MPDTAGEKVRCADCGYLSGRLAKDLEFYEVSQTWRDSGVPDGPNGLARSPHCFKNAYPIADEYQSAFQSATGSAEEKKKSTFLKVIRAERSCPDHCEYEQGKSPKEHAEEQDEMRAVMESQKLVASEADKNREWQASEAEKNRRAQAEEAERNRKAQTEEAERNRQAQAEQNRMQRELMTQLAEKERRTKLTLWVLGGVGAVLFAVGGFFGGRYFAPPATTDSPVQTSPPTKP